MRRFYSRAIFVLAVAGMGSLNPHPALCANSTDLSLGDGPDAVSASKSSAAVAGNTASIDSIKVTNRGNTTDLTISGKNLKKPSVEKIDGQKLVAKFRKTLLNIPPKIGENDPLIKAVRSSDHASTAWVVIDTVGLNKWNLKKSGESYVFSLTSGGSAPPRAAASEGGSEAGNTSEAGKRSSDRLIDFSLKPMETGVKIVLTSDGPAKYTVRKLAQPEKLVIRFHGTRLEILEKDKKLKEARAFQKQGLLLMELRQIGPRFSPISEAILTLIPGTTHQVSRDLNQIVITLIPPPAFEKAEKKGGNLNQNVSVDLEGADLSAVLKTLASEAGFNVDFVNPVNGVVNEKLKDIPLKSALAILLSPGGYDYEVQGNTLRIGTQLSLRATKGILPHITEIITPTGGMTPNQFDALVRGILRLTNGATSTFDTVRNVIILNGTASDIEDYKRTIRDLKLGEDAGSSRITRIVKLNYAEPADMVTMMSPYLTPIGRVQADIRTHSLVIWESETNMGVLLELVKEIDIKNPQVLIEASIVEVNNENDLNLGIDWTADKVTGDPTMSGAVHLPPANPLARPGDFSFGTIKSGFNINATLHALESKKNGKVISRPRIATTSGVQATINTTENVIYVTNNQILGLGGVVQTTQIINTLPLPISLQVTPRISEDGYIHTLLDVRVTSVSGPAVPPAPPPTNIQSANTVITTKNGDTIVIGGLVRDVSQDNVNGIPILSSIPIIGTLFQQKEKSVRKEELVIFITPTILED